MKDGVPRHPEAQTMAAFIEGTLSRGEVAAVAEHLRGCGDCRTVVSETARFEREEQPETSRTWWLAAAAIVAAILVALPFVVRVVRRDTSPIAGLIAAAPHEHRSVEARLSGFPFARLQAPSRGEAKPDPADLKLKGAAGAVLDATAGRRDSASGHAKGVAYVVIGRINDGIVALERAANSSKDPKTWNDLAAARYAAATADEHPSQLPEALADVDHALRLDPRFAEARFNRALILERLGVLDQARKAWAAYLDVDNGSEWSVEARGHLRALGATSRRFDPKMLETTDPASLVREFPEEARRWGEAVLLSQWAGAREEQRPAILSSARAIGDALAASNGEHLLADAVSAIERSTGMARTALIEAYPVYHVARVTYEKRNAGVSELQLRQAATLFRQGGSPMADVALYYAACAAFDQHHAGARDELQRLLTAVDQRRYRALTAQIEWEITNAAIAAGDWGAAARNADSSVSIFRALGERANAGRIDSIGAMAYEVMGERDLAWSRRVRAYAELSANGSNSQLDIRIHNAVATLAPLDQDAAAVALIDLIVDDARMRNDAYVLTEILASRAREAGRTNDEDVARRSIEEARRSVAHVDDPALREDASAQTDLAEAALRSRTAPGAALAALDRSIPLFGRGRLERYLPEAYLQRGRAHRALGDATAALADYASAMSEIEKQDSTAVDAEARLAFLDTASHVVDEAIDLQLARGATVGAFEIADRSRTLVEPLLSVRDEILSMPGDAAIIEYAVRPHAVTLFCVSKNGISADTVAVERRDLAIDVDAFADRIRERAPIDEIRREGTALYQLLIAPVRLRLAGASEIVLVPDQQLYAIPFSALWDDREKKYLVEQYDIRFAPGARRTSTTPRELLAPALVISDPSAMHAPPLFASRDEASRIASLQGAVLLAGEMATRARFLELAPRSALIHFAGHANSDASESYGALLFAAGKGDSGVLSSGDIARLALPSHPLVILAACGTFRGNATHVAGMSSLARSFLIAGARGVVGTLWEIDDDVSAPLFTQFHQHLRPGVSPSRSLRAVQLDALRSHDARTAHPATWAPVEFLSSV